jgi:beta-glucosidase
LLRAFPIDWQDNPTWSHDPSIYLCLDGKVRYEDGLFIGCHHYEKQDITPMFPFGFGLSYATFEVSDVAAQTSDLSALDVRGSVVISRPAQDIACSQC